MKQIYSLIFLGLFPVMLSGQTNTDFWFAAPEVTSGHGDQPIYLRLTSFDQVATVTISEPANIGNFPTQNVTIPANSTVTVDLTAYKEQIECKPANTVLNLGLHIHSTVPITAYYEEANTQNPEIFTLKGNNALGTSFYIPSQDTLYNHTPLSPSAYNTFDIVATEDGTTLTITPNRNIVGHPEGVPFQVTLNKGQVYSAQATGQQGRDHLMGSTVTSDKAISITVKDDSDQFPGQGCYDLTGDQIVPVNIIGEQYIVVRGYANNAMNDWVFVTAVSDNTNVSVNGTLVTTLAAGETYRYRLLSSDLSSFVETSAPAYVYHLTGYGCEAGAAILPPMNCTGSSQVAFARTTQFSFEMIILTKDGAQGFFTLDGNSTLVTSGMFSPVTGNSTYVYARIEFPVGTLPVGVHRLVNTQDIFHMGIIHTYNSGQSGCSYGYFTDFASLNLGPDQSVCPGTSVTFDAGPGRLSYEWYYNGTSYATGVQTITVSTTGMYSVTVNDHGCILSDTASLSNYTPPAPPTGTSPVTRCGNGEVTITATAAPGDRIDWYDAPSGGILLGTGNSYTTGFLPAPITVIYYAEAVTISTSCISTTRTPITVIVKEIPDLTVTPGSTTQCSGQTTNILLQSNFSGANITWVAGSCINIVCPPGGNGPPGSYITDLLNLTDYSVPGSLIYQITSTYDGCTSSVVSHPVTINAFPPVSLSDFAPVCLNTPPFPLTGGTPAGGTYTLNGNPIVIFNPALVGVGTHPITYTYTDVNGCTASQTKSITVQSLITPTLSGSSIACVGVAQTYTTDPGMVASSYQWSVTPNGTIQAGANPWVVNITWPTTGPKTITVTYTDPNGCTTIPANKTVNVNSLPIPSLNGNLNACFSQTYSYTTDPGMQNYTWAVSPGNSLTVNGSMATVTWNVISPNEWIEVNYTDANGCSAAVPLRKTVNVNPLPSYAVAGSANVCAGSTNVVYSLPVGQTGSWSIPTGGGSITGPSTNVNSIIVNWFTNAVPLQSILVSYTNSLGCANSTTKDVYVQTLPVVTFTTNTPSPVCQDFPSPSLYTVDPGGPAATYLWQVTPAANAVIANPTANPASITWKLSGSTPQTAQLSLTATTSGTNPLCSSTSAPLTVTINPKPIVQLTSCFDPVTSRSAKRFLLKGGTPLLTSTPQQGEYLSNPPTPALLSDAAGNYYFEPSLVPGNQTTSFNISYRYTSSQFGCPATSSSIILTVRGANPPCGTSMTDYRDGTSYRTSLIAGKCWMTENLRYGNLLSPPTTSQTDNCIVEKYCLSSDPSCNTYGGLYQWDELIQYGVTAGPDYQGVCPPGWHIPTSGDFQALIDANKGNGLAGAVLTDLNLIPRGFEALLGGMYYLNTSWAFMANSYPRGTMFWTSTPGSSNKIITRGMNFPNYSVSYYESSKANAFPVRCVKD